MVNFLNSLITHSAEVFGIVSTVYGMYNCEHMKRAPDMGSLTYHMLDEGRIPSVSLLYVTNCRPRLG